MSLTQEKELTKSSLEIRLQRLTELYQMKAPQTLIDAENDLIKKAAKAMGRLHDNFTCHVHVDLVPTFSRN